MWDKQWGEIANSELQTFWFVYLHFLARNIKIRLQICLQSTLPVSFSSLYFFPEFLKLISIKTEEDSEWADNYASWESSGFLRVLRSYDSSVKSLKKVFRVELSAPFVWVVILWDCCLWTTCSTHYKHHLQSSSVYLLQSKLLLHTFMVGLINYK